jgi:hypothetical protein
VEFLVHGFRVPVKGKQEIEKSKAGGQTIR